MSTNEYALLNYEYDIYNDFVCEILEVIDCGWDNLNRVVEVMVIEVALHDVTMVIGLFTDTPLQVFVGCVNAE